MDNTVSTSTSHESFPPQIGPYLIEGKLGAGGMGTVYKAHHAETGQSVAVKVLPASLAREEGFVERFNREIDALQKLENPHVVKLFDHGVDGDTSYYSMEYIDGETLTRKLLRERRLPWREVIEITVQICSALKAAHDAGIIHRDLKPSNLMITSDGQIKLADFGVAQVFAASKLTVTGGIIGTAEYMSPEQTQGQRVTKKSDLYSLGAVMYVMLTGRPPFTGKTTIDIIQKHRFAQFDRPRTIVPEIPSWLDEIVCMLLDKNPDNRLPDAFVLSRRLQEVVRKVELSSTEQTVQLSSDGVELGPTRTVGNEAEGRHGYHGPGVGTMMRNFLRAEIESEHRGTHLSNMMGSIYFLVTALILLIAGGFWWFRPSADDPQARFDAGLQLMELEPGPQWIEARDDYFRPLVAQDPEAWEEKVAPYLEKIDLYELKTTFNRRPLRQAAFAKNEVERLLKLAQHYQTIGEAPRAESILSSLLLLLDDEQYSIQKKLVEELLNDLREQRQTDTDRYQLAGESLDRADELAQAGDREQADDIRRAVIELYADDPEAAQLTDRARQGLLQEPPQASK